MTIKAGKYTIKERNGRILFFNECGQYFEVNSLLDAFYLVLLKTKESKGL